MKALTTLVFISLINLSLFSQNKIYQNSVENVKSIENVTANNAGGRGFDYRYEGTKGSPLIFNTYKKGTILFNNKTKLENVLINFDNHSNLISFIDPEKKDTLFVNNETAHTIIILENKTIYQSIASSYFEKQFKKNTMFKLLEINETYALVKFRKVSLKKANYEGAYSADERSDEFLQEDRYYVRVGDTKFIQIRPKKSSLIKAFPEKKQKISSFLKENKFTSSDEMLFAVFATLFLKN